MHDLLPKTLRCRIDGITLEVCHGEIPDIFRQLRYDPVTEFELPDTKVRNIDERGCFVDEFQEWLTLYRHANPWFELQLLEEAQCN